MYIETVLIQLKDFIGEMKSDHTPNKGLQVIPLAFSLAELFHGAQHLKAGNLSLKGFGKSLWRNTESITV